MGPLPRPFQRGSCRLPRRSPTQDRMRRAASVALWTWLPEGCTPGVSATVAPSSLGRRRRVARRQHVGRKLAHDVACTAIKGARRVTNRQSTARARVSIDCVTPSRKDELARERLRKRQDCAPRAHRAGYSGTRRRGWWAGRGRWRWRSPRARWPPTPAPAWERREGHARMRARRAATGTRRRLTGSSDKRAPPATSHWQATEQPSRSAGRQAGMRISRLSRQAGGRTAMLGSSQARGVQCH
jgi:hypothetical protein